MKLDFIRILTTRPASNSFCCAPMPKMSQDWDLTTLRPVVERLGVKGAAAPGFAAKQSVGCEGFFQHNLGFRAS